MELSLCINDIDYDWYTSIYLKEVNDGTIKSGKSLYLSGLEKLLDISKYDSINEEQRKEIYDVIDDIEEARHALYELKNEMRTHTA